MAAGHGHKRRGWSDSTERLRASKEEKITALPIVHYTSHPFACSFLDVLGLLSYCHFFIWMLFQPTHIWRMHSSALLVKATLLTQLRPTQEERTEVWRIVLWNSRWDLQDVCLKIMMHRRGGRACTLMSVSFGCVCLASDQICYYI